MNVLFELVLLCMISPRRRLRLLGNPTAKSLVHVGFLVVNMIIHYETLIGTMSAILAFVCSIATIRFAEKLFGHIEADRYYHVGWVKYSVEEIK